MNDSASLLVAQTKRATVSDAFHKNNETRHRQWRVLSKPRTSEMERCCAFCIYKKQTRHCQWHAAIRIFEILRFSLLFLIILI
jgi:hypothetical protein